MNKKEKQFIEWLILKTNRKEESIKSANSQFITYTESNVRSFEQDCLVTVIHKFKQIFEVKQ